MSVVGGPDIITEGLNLCLDASNNKSYPDSGNILYDLSGKNNNATKVGNPAFISTYPKSFSFGTSADGFSVLDAPSLDLSGSKTLAIWCKLSAISNGCGFAAKATSLLKGMALGYGWNGNGFMALAWNSSNNPYIARDVNRDLSWCFLVATQDSSTNIRYIYVFDSIGLRQSSFSGGTHSWDNSLNFMIGGTSELASRPPSGTLIGYCLIYSRALSLGESAKNFEVLKERFIT